MLTKNMTMEKKMPSLKHDFTGLANFRLKGWQVCMHLYKFDWM
jgi:hypothetical protein